MKKYSVLFLLFLGVCELAQGQQDAQYTQYMFNTMSVNPAYAGSRGQLSFTGLYRSQWAGLRGAPETLNFNLHSPARNSRIGYGISIINDNIGDGAVQETFLDGVISYTIPVSEAAKLSFGLKVGGNFLSLDFTKLRNFDQEVVAQDNIDQQFSPNFGLGIYYHTDRFYLGASVPNLLETEYFDNTGNDSSAPNFLAAERMNFYLITGYVWDLGPNLKFKPALLTKAVGGAPLQIDLSANMLFADRFYGGLAYRIDASVSLLAGFQISDQIMLGMAYDREITELGAQQFNDGSFEIFLRVELLKRFQRTLNPRFF